MRARPVCADGTALCRISTEEHRFVSSEQIGAGGEEDDWDRHCGHQEQFDDKGGPEQSCHRRALDLL